MAGEELVAYQIRMTARCSRTPRSGKAVDLGIIAADRAAFNNVLAEIRADAIQAGLNPVGLPLFRTGDHRGPCRAPHRYRFVGNGTIFKQLSRPVRCSLSSALAPQLTTEVGRPRW